MSVSNLNISNARKAFQAAVLSKAMTTAVVARKSRIGVPWELSPKSYSRLRRAQFLGGETDYDFVRQPYAVWLRSLRQGDGSSFLDDPAI
jgi:hypothetical protein